jgi:hypothetical protein
MPAVMLGPNNSRYQVVIPVRNRAGIVAPQYGSQTSVSPLGTPASSRRTDWPLLLPMAQPVAPAAPGATFKAVSVRG